MSIATPVAIRCSDLGKRFGATQALVEVDLYIAAGTVHALVGENGAGKSTCLGIIGGRIAPTSGSVTIGSTPLDHGDPRASRRAGVAVIYQELTIVPQLTTQANVFLGNERSRRGIRSERAMRREFLELCGQMEVTIPADVPAGTLPVADQQLLEIQRALATDPKIILFDEPTASLAEHERHVLFRVMRDLRRKGVTLVLVSHNLDEVLSISDEVTVFRNGRKVVTHPVTEWTKPALVEAMLGQDIRERAPRRALPAIDVSRTPLVRVRELVVPGVLGPVDFEVRGGEVLGIGGVVGSGRTTLLTALAGLVPKATGRLWIEGDQVPWPTSARSARALGIALVPEDRQLAGLFRSMTASDNVTISDYRPVARHGWLSASRMRCAATQASSTVAFDPARLPVPAGALSGGNQQKLILARWQHCPPRVLLCDEPTRGIDIGAKAEVMNNLRELTKRGVAVLLASSELEEIEDHADRALVLSEGRQVGEVSNADDSLTARNILTLAFRAEEMRA